MAGRGVSEAVPLVKPRNADEHNETALPILVAYAAPAAGFSFILFFVQFYFLKFATDVLLMAPALIGVMFGLGRVWDAITDPLVGFLSDRTRSRFGRRRPWMLAGIPLLLIFFGMVWSPPTSLSQGELAVWCAVALLGFYAAYTVYTIPHQALGAELSTDHHRRSRVFGAQRMAFVFGMLLAFTAIGYASNASDPRGAVLWIAGTGGVLAALFLLATPLLVAERSEYVGRGGASPYAALRDVWRNPHARVLLVAWFIEGLGGGVLGVLAPYVSEYVLKRPDLIAVIPAFFVLSSVASIPVWIALSRRIGKRDSWLIALVGSGIFFGATFFVGPGDVVLLCGLLVGAGVSAGCGGAIGLSMLADTIDFDEFTSGQRKEGAYSAAWGFALKLAIGGVIMLTGVALQLSGFEPNVEQTPTAQLTLRGLFAGAPLIGSFCALWVLRGFSLDATEHARIRGELDRRAGGESER